MRGLAGTGRMMEFRYDIPIAPLRRDISAAPVTEDGVDYVELYDPSGYAARSVRLRPEAIPIIAMLDGRSSVEDLHLQVLEATGVAIPQIQIHHLVEALSEYCYLEDSVFAAVCKQSDDEYRELGERQPAHAGSSYLASEPELRAFFDALFELDATPRYEGDLLGIVVPHIDLTVGPEVYVPAMKQLAAAEFDIAVILGTSHYSFEDQFIMTEKDFVTPFGVMPTDKAFVSMLREQTGHIFTTRDAAHRPEHSIEFPVLFLQYLFGNSSKTILPILCTSFEEMLSTDGVPIWHERYRTFLDGFQRTAQVLGKKVMFILSVDWSHIGKKFGDEFAAGEVLHVIEQSDRLQIEALERADYPRFHSLLANTDNASRIDGYSCITTFFDLVHPARGKLFAYRQWHEEERESAVTFAAMGFYGDAL
jgi:MEMO1 family protein